jgi:hypothetical protein
MTLEEIALIQCDHEPAGVSQRRSANTPSAGFAALGGRSYEAALPDGLIWHVNTGMPPLEVSRGTDGELVINNGVTRATRIARFSPGTALLVEVIDDLPIPVGKFPSIGDLVP